MRRMLIRAACLLLVVTMTPTLAYECMQKSSEWLLPHRARAHGFFRLSDRAEEETRWRPRTGLVVVDHALHEWAETRRFYVLAKRRIDSPYH